MNYTEALAFLFPRVTTIRFGLDTTRQLLARLGAPHRLMPTIHIGGTNGKGSVTTLVSAALRAALTARSKSRCHSAGVSR